MLLHNVERSKPIGMNKIGTREVGSMMLDGASRAIRDVAAAVPAGRR